MKCIKEQSGKIIRISDAEAVKRIGNGSDRYVTQIEYRAYIIAQKNKLRKASKKNKSK